MRKKTEKALKLCRKMVYFNYVIIIGGFYDAIYMKRIIKYANLKYKKRFLINKK